MSSCFPVNGGGAQAQPPDVASHRRKGGLLRRTAERVGAKGVVGKQLNRTQFRTNRVFHERETLAIGRPTVDIDRALSSLRPRQR